MIMIPTMIDGSLLLYAPRERRETSGRPVRSCFRAGSDRSTPLLTPFAPATWSDRSLLILAFFSFLHVPPSRHHHRSFLSVSPFNPFRSPRFSSSRSSSLDILVCLFLPPLPPVVFRTLFPSGSDFQVRDLTAVSYLLRARILFGAPFNYLVRNSNEEEQLLY